MNKYLLILIKIIISLGLLTFLFVYKIDRQAFIQQIQQIVHESNIWMLVLCIVLYGLGQVLSTFKWSLLIHSHGLKHPFQNLLSYYFVGMFFNLFMPSIVGGDAQRCYAVYKDEQIQSDNTLPKGRLSQIISSVMMERVTGVIAMIWLANIAYFFFFKNISFSIPKDDHVIYVLLPQFLFFLFTSTILFLIVIYLFPISPSETWQKKGFLFKILHSLINISAQLGSYIKSIQLFIGVMLISFLFQSMIVIINYLLGLGLGLNIPVTYYFIVVPLITICTALPISVGGLGVREAAYVYFLQFAKIDSTHAILFSFSYVITVAINALIGGIILFKRGFHIEKTSTN